MEVKDKILKRKIIGDIPEEEMKMIEEACELEKRSRISLIRIASVEYAKKVLLKNQVKNGANTIQ